MQKNGFTLLELSIVIVIIGLIVAGISAGQSLVRQANLRAVISDVNGFKVALNGFKLQYDAIPGDMVNAADYWPGITTSGDGDRQIEANTLLASPVEDIAFWEHLALAGLLSGTYTGAVGSSERYEVGVNTPAAGLSGGAYQPYYVTGSVYGRSLANMIQFGSKDGNYQGYLNGQIVRPREGLAIDQKMDDGDEDSGEAVVVVSYQYAASTTDCTDGPFTNPTANLVLSSDTIACSMLFWLD